MTNEDGMLSKDCEDSPSVEEFRCGGNLGGGGPLKKGPWTAAEDAVLVDYVNKHGEGNWNAVQKYSGLSRCGKSCRLRWANHLRPDLKKGAFTEEEERRIIELHAKMGNKWARMAAELPGRTDNEIKNYWNTRIKRRQRAGLPIYPPDVCQVVQENQHCQNTRAFPTGKAHHPDLFLTNSLEIPAVDFKNLELNQQLYSPTLLEIPASNLMDIPARSSALTQGLGSSYNLVFSMLHPSKRLRESESLLPGINSSTTDGFPAFDEFREDGREKIAAQSFGFSAVYGHDLNANQPSSSSVDPGSHAFLNGNSSSSEPMSWVMKSELPSLQYSDAQVGSWGTSPSPLPSLESVDPLIQSPPMELDSLSRRNSGLLDAVLYESQTLKSSKNSSCHQNSSISIVANDVYSLSQNLCETECDVYSDPISPLGHSVTSVFSENTPISGTSFGEPPAVEMLPMPGCKVKQEAVDWVTTKCNVKEENEDQENICSRPDFLLASNWFGHNTERGREHSVLTDAIGALVGEDFSGDCKQSSTLCASSGQKSGRESCAWDSLSTAK